jgi:hypothetical protein
VDAGAKATAGEHGGQDPVCQLAQLTVALLRLFERLADQRLDLAVIVLGRSLSQLERQDRVHQPLLRPVVQIPHDPASRLVSGGEQTRPRGDELVTAVGVRDGGVEHLGELGHALFGVFRRRPLAAPAAMITPQTARRRRSALRRPS